jgi:hypothetical protein
MQTFRHLFLDHRWLPLGVLLGLMAGGAALLTRNLAQAPDLWKNIDVGRTGLPGKVIHESDRIMVQGSGADIWGGADAFHFLYQSWSGDGEFVARVLSVENTHPWAKAGIMLRVDLDQTSAHAMLAVTPNQGAVFIRRQTPGGPSKDDAHQAMRMVREGSGVAFQQRGSAGVESARDSIMLSNTPHWIKLVRRGEILAAMESSDGVEWQWLGTVRSGLPRTLLVGLAVSSHNNNELCAAVFDHVSFTQLSESSTEPLDSGLGEGDGLLGRYYNSINHSGPSLTRLDPEIDFNWGSLRLKVT